MENTDQTPPPSAPTPGGPPDAEVARLRAALVESEHRVRRMQASFSWKATAPLRALRRALGLPSAQAPLPAPEVLCVPPPTPAREQPQAPAPPPVPAPPSEAEPAAPADTAPALLGCVDQPAAWAVPGPSLFLRGWCLAPSGPPVSAMRLQVGGASFPVHYGRRRPDVAAAHPAAAGALASGFTADAVVSPGVHALRLEAEREGRWIPFVETELKVDAEAARPAPHSYEFWVHRYDTPSPEHLAELGARLSTLHDAPRVSVLVPVYNPEESYLRACLDSVFAQVYPHWELCLADDASTRPHVRRVLEEYAARDPRVKVCLRPANGHICEATNSALALAGGRLVAFLDHDDTLAPHALALAVLEFAAHPRTVLAYTDEDKIDERGARSSPHFKPDWDPDLLSGQNYLCHLCVYRRDAVLSAGGLRPGTEGAQDWDLALRVTAGLEPDRVRHIPAILYHWRMHESSTSLFADAKDYVPAAVARILGEHSARIGWAGAAIAPVPGGHWRLRPPASCPTPPAAVILPTRDRADLIGPCLESLLGRTSYPDFRVIIVDHGTEDAAAAAILARAAGDPRVRVLRAGGPFNFSALANLGAAHSEPSDAVLVLLNNDIEVPAGAENWLGELVAQATRPGVGAVGACLLYPDGKLQHAGVVLGIHGSAGHVLRGQADAVGLWFNRPHLLHRVSAVTGACLAVRRELWEKTGGFDERELPVSFNDIDFCLRLDASGYRNLYCPAAKLVHRESASRAEAGGSTDADRERALRELDVLRRRWGQRLCQDPWYSPSLTHEDESGSLAFPPRRLWWPAPGDAAAAGVETPERLERLAHLAAANRPLLLSQLDGFLHGCADLVLPPAAEPAVSVVVVLHQRAELTLRCIQALLGGAGPTWELILVDNASTDATERLLRKVRGATILRLTENLHFLEGCRRGAALARGRHLLFLNSDTEVSPGALAEALAALESSPSVGAVGARLVQPDGRLQEAGCILWRDGTTLGVGRGDDPARAAYAYRREVDYVSGAFLLTPRAVWEELGGFDPEYSPAYYEEVDYCIRLRQSGRRVLYEPRALVLHHEFASSSNREQAFALMHRNRARLVDRHRDWLQGQTAPGPGAVPRALRAGRCRQRVLVVEDRIPSARLGAGYPRTLALLRGLHELGCRLTVFPAEMPCPDPTDAARELPPEVEIVDPARFDGPEGFLSARSGLYDTVVLCRPHNLARLAALVPTGVRLVYDAEAVFALREARHAGLLGRPLSEPDLAAAIERELAPARAAAAVLCVSPAEADLFRRHGARRVEVLGHAVHAAAGSRDFESRAGLLFVGSVHADNTPNGDALAWYAAEVLPALRRLMPQVPVLEVAGIVDGEDSRHLSSEHIRLLGPVEDLSETYERARVFVCPVRYGSGIPIKVIEAAAHGLPVAATEYPCGQLGWSAGVEVQSGGDAQALAQAIARLYQDKALWEATRRAALERVQAEYAPARFAQTLEEIFPPLPCQDA